VACLKRAATLRRSACTGFSVARSTVGAPGLVTLCDKSRLLVSARVNPNKCKSYDASGNIRGLSSSTRIAVGSSASDGLPTGFPGLAGITATQYDLHANLLPHEEDEPLFPTGSNHDYAEQLLKEIENDEHAVAVDLDSSFTHNPLPSSFNGQARDDKIASIQELISEGSEDGLSADDIAYLKTLVEDSKPGGSRKARKFAASSPPQFMPEAGDTYDLVQRQFALEEESFQEAMSMYRTISSQLQKMGVGSTQKRVNNYILEWYGPLVAAITKEINSIQSKVVTRGSTLRVRRIYSNFRYCCAHLLNCFFVFVQTHAPYILMLPPEKQAMITLNTVVNELLRKRNLVTTVELVKKIGAAIEVEVQLDKTKQASHQWHVSVLRTALKSNSGMLLMKLKKLLGSTEGWPEDGQVIIGSELVRLMLETSKTRGSGEAAFTHEIRYGNDIKQGLISMEKQLFKDMTANDVFSLPRHLPMLVAPRVWDNKKKNSSCFLRLDCSLVRTNSKQQSAAVRRANMTPLLDCINYLGSIGWRINDSMYEVVTACWEQDMQIGELPAREDHPLPSKDEAYRRPYRPNLAMFKKTSKMSNAEYDTRLEQYKKILAEHPDENDPYWSTPGFDENYFNKLSKHVGMKNADLKSLRCDLEIKLSIAKRYIGEKFYFPYNIDFRGRAYPVPPNLNHIGSDMCRGLLKFDKAMPLGPTGLNWLKIHLCNLFGNNKISQQDRITWADSNLHRIRASAADPLGSSENCRWWMDGEKPFQILATCKEIVGALDSGNPETYLCALPIHQDGSCNGLQHYAALGRDLDGGKAVNLCPSSKPQDVYSKVLEIVNRKISEDAKLDENHEDLVVRRRGQMARLLTGEIDRKVIKQSVMTSVYGVTRRGATLQVFARLEEKLIAAGDISMGREREIMPCAMYVAELTMDSLGELFNSAHVIMKWLGECANIVATQGQSMSWISPLGLPIMQPYRRNQIQRVRTLLQTIVLSTSNDALPVSRRKQQSAFPPNFVHSLDATHMALTALKMKELGLTFASVHDSYWTHACDVDKMNEVRDKR
jgi:DNA-directed RNA polymerase